MAIETVNPEAQKITVTIPITLLNRLNERIPKRQRSEFIVEAIEEYLALEEQSAAIEETAGAWTDEHHPDLHSGEAIDRWLTEFRKGWGDKAQESCTR
ncbi:MAG: hypothetical protein KF832_31835 [Caldilineaceae bacterium]|nr:hypothetical protein [Caldilineaceae bacterium]